MGGTDARVQVGLEQGDLLARYAESHDAELRDQIVVAYTPLVRRIVSKSIFSGAPTEDIRQVGYIGLLKAIERFDPGRGVKFVTYARHLIRREIRHYLRDHGDIIRKPRWLWRLSGQIEQAVDRYVSEEGRFPRLDELTTALNLEEERLLGVLKARDVLRTISLATDDETGELRIDRDGAPHETNASSNIPIEDKIVLFEAIEKLNSLERRVLYYRFFTDLAQTETAKHIGISQKHVSRVLASSLGKLRGLLDPATLPPSDDHP